MARRALFIVIGTLVVALAVVVFVGVRVTERDREALLARYGHDRAQGIEEAARSLTEDVADIGEDLELAATLLAGADTTGIAERELHAIATIKREYMAMHARTGTGETTKVIAFDAPEGVGPRTDAALDRMLQLAAITPGVLHASGPISSAGDAATWYRVFARRPTAHGPAVAVAVDMSILLGRMKVQRDAATKIAIVDASGTPSSTSDRGLAGVLNADAFAPMLASAPGPHASTTIDRELARQIGLPDAPAVAISVPLAIDNGAPWRIVVVASTQALQVQETRIVSRVLVGGGLVLLLLLSAAAYVLYNTFRARTLRERVRHMDRLAHLTEKAEKILDHIPSGVLALSDDLHVTGVNRWLAERLGRDVVGRPLGAVFVDGKPEDVSAVLELVDGAREAREPRALQRERISVLGAEASLNVRAVPLARGVGDVAVLLVFDDVTELRRIEQRLLHSEKLVTAGQLAAGIAHEVGTPLNVARGRVELSLAHLGTDHPEADNQQVVMDQIDRVTRLLQQLLDYVRPAPMVSQQVDLDRVLGVVNELLAPQVAKQKVSLVVESAPVRLQADPDQLQQIVVNLVLNAVAACKPGGRVTLRAHAVASKVVLEIADDGHGIPRELQKQVFDPFFTTKKRGQGTGLGLWVVAQLVRAQAAEIELESEVDRGTTVRVTWQVER